MSAEGFSSPSFRIRVRNFIPWLAGEEIAVSPLPLFSSRPVTQFRVGPLRTQFPATLRARRDLKRALVDLHPATDVTWLLRQADVLGVRSLERRAIADRALVYEVDDAIWLDTTVEATDRRVWIRRSASKSKWLAERANQVIAGNELLAEHLAQFAESVTVIPSCVDTDEIAIKEHGQREQVVIGWIGSQGTAHYLDGLAPTLAAAAREMTHSRLKLLVVGASAPHVGGLEVEAREWSLENQRSALAEIDIGLMPLSNTPWARGKGGSKAVLYLAAGIPTIASDVGVAAQIVGDAGYLARKPADWIEAVDALASDVSTRAKLGARGRDHIEANYSIRRWAPTLADVLRRARVGV